MSIDSERRADGDVGPAANEEAISAMWTGTASKLVFRSTDGRTAAGLRALSARHRARLASIVEVCPLCGLSCPSPVTSARTARRRST